MGTGSVDNAVRPRGARLVVHVIDIEGSLTRDRREGRVAHVESAEERIPGRDAVQRKIHGHDHVTRGRQGIGDEQAEHAVAAEAVAEDDHRPAAGRTRHAGVLIGHRHQDRHRFDTLQHRERIGDGNVGGGRIESQLVERRNVATRLGSPEFVQGRNGILFPRDAAIVRQADHAKVEIRQAGQADAEIRSAAGRRSDGHVRSLHRGPQQSEHRGNGLGLNRPGQDDVLGIDARAGSGRLHGARERLELSQGLGRGVVDEWIGALTVLVDPRLPAFREEVGLVRRRVVAGRVVDVVGQHGHVAGVLVQRLQGDDGQHVAARERREIHVRGQLANDAGDRHELLRRHLEDPYGLTRNHGLRIDGARIAVVVDEGRRPAFRGAEAVIGVDLVDQGRRGAFETVRGRVQGQVRGAQVEEVVRNRNPFQAGGRVEDGGQDAGDDTAVLVLGAVACCLCRGDRGRGDHEHGQQQGQEISRFHYASPRDSSRCGPRPGS